MHRSLVALLFVAACNGGQGVDIEVHQGSQTIDAVELWLAYDVCKLPDGKECDGIGWPSAQLRLSGDVYTLGEDEKLVRTDVIVDGVAQLHLEATQETHSPYVIAVVGYHGGSIVGVKMLSDVEIPVSDQAHWRIELHDVGQVTENMTAAPGDKPGYNALVWARKPSSTLPDASGYTGCFAYQKWNGSQWETKYIVPPSDPDCDGDPPDCNPYWYNASTSNARCVTASANLAGVCVVGNLSCRSEIDGLSCSAQASPLICVPSSVCTQCGDTTDLQTCVKEQVSTDPSATSSPVPTQICAMVSDLDGPCTNTTQPATGWQAKFFVRGGACTPNAQNQTVMLRPIYAPFMGGTGMITLNGANILAHASPVTTGTVGCQVDVTWASGSTDPGVQPVIVALSYGPGREILIPLLLDIQKPDGTGLCPTSVTPQPCRQVGNWPENLLPGDSMFKCTL